MMQCRLASFSSFLEPASRISCAGREPSSGETTLRQRPRRSCRPLFPTLSYLGRGCITLQEPLALFHQRQGDSRTQQGQWVQIQDLAN